MKSIYFLKENADSITSVLSKSYHLNADQYTAEDMSGGLTRVEINDEGRKYDSKVYIALANDSLEAYLSIYPPLGTGSKLTLEEIKKAIADEGVRVNLNEEAIAKIAELHYKDYIVERTLIAVGQPPVKGRDASIILQFSTAEKRPKLSDSGRVDYKNIDNIIHAKKGDVLITKRPATRGIRGVTVKNGEISPVPGKDVEIYYSEGVMMNPTGTTFVATHDGYVEFNGTTISVHEVYFVNHDVDYSTGNIRFNGTVHVKGDVLSGFRIEAKKDVIVEGVCGDCEILALKNINIKLGIKGNFSNLFRAGGNIVIGYGENAKVLAKNDIIIKKYSYNCDLYAGNRIDASSGDGIIAGGMVKAFSELMAKQLGTHGNSRFTVYMGTKYYIDQKLERLRREKARLMEKLGQIQDMLGKFNLSRADVINNPKIKNLQDLKRNFESVIAEMGEYEEDYLTQSRADKPKIKIKGVVHSGVTVMFFNCSSTVREPIENAVFFLDEKYAEVAWVSLKDIKTIETQQ
jgi:uncharacterized protein (DUF342 family)